MVALRLLDTNIVSYVFNRHTLATAYAPHLAGHTLAISFMTPAELWEGVLRTNWSASRRARLNMVVRSYTILDSSLDICRRWAEIRYERRAQPISVDDAWIAATALIHAADLVTHNPGDFQGITGLTIITESP